MGDIHLDCSFGPDELLVLPTVLEDVLEHDWTAQAHYFA
jgi:hypothetical protein